jgi:quercetin dioxygenase-like cupin family protein
VHAREDTDEERFGCVRRSGRGKRGPLDGPTSTHFFATGQLTGGGFALVEESSARGVSVPLHRHVEDVESFYVLEGEMSFFLGDRPGIRASAGAFAHIPAGIVHGFRIESMTARYLILTTPHHAEFYRAITLPTPHATVDDSVIGAACRQYGIEFIGPLPE